jgi:hypothetical protein
MEINRETRRTDREDPDRPPRQKRQRATWQFKLAAVAWAALGGLALVQGINASRGTQVDEGGVGRIENTLGDRFAAAAEYSSHPVLMVGLGMAILLCTGLLMIGMGWARYALIALGVATVIALAVAARWETLVALAILFLASLLLLSPRTSRYLRPSR